MPHLSANLGFLWPDRPLPKRIEAAARAGFGAVEFHWPYDFEATSIARQCRDAGLAVLSVNAPAGERDKGEFGFAALAECDDRYRDSLHRALDYCAALGGRSVHVLAGFLSPTRRAEARPRVIANLAYATEQAARRNLSILIEAINRRDAPDYFYDDVDDAAAIVDEVQADNLRLMFDAYHVGISGGDVFASLERHWPRIGHVQIAAIPTRHEPDEGVFDYKPFFQRLDALHYSGWVGCEYLPRGDTDSGLKWVALLNRDAP